MFDGAEDVTAESRINIFKAGDRQAALAESRARRVVETSVAQGMYDAQIIREREGRVLNIRWAERLIVMPYPDEAGRHLEVINFQNGFGALEVRGHDPGDPDVAIFSAGSHDQEAAKTRRRHRLRALRRPRGTLRSARATGRTNDVAPRHRSARRSHPALD